MFKIFRERLSDCLYYNFMNILMEPGSLFLSLFFFGFLSRTGNGCSENLEDIWVEEIRIFNNIWMQGKSRENCYFDINKPMKFAFKVITEVWNINILKRKWQKRKSDIMDLVKKKKNIYQDV